MKRLLLGIFSALLLAAPAVPAQAAGVNGFRITNYDIQFELSRDGENRSVLSTTETITADFYNLNNNHGIERAIPKSYDGHSVSLDVKSVKKADGSDWTYKSRSENGNEILRIGDADTYVNGEHTFVIEYSARDVTKTFSNMSDEFYWDTNGTDWSVATGNLDVTLKVDDELASALTDKAVCYKGREGSTNTCELVRSGNEFKVNETFLGPRENVSIAVGFQNGTFANYKKSLWENVVSAYVTLLIITSVISLAVIIWLVARYTKWTGRKDELGTIIAEYTPPKDASVAAAATLVTAKSSVFSAQLLDFAVRGYLKLYQTSDKSFWKSAEYDIEIVQDTATLKAEEQEILSDVFDGKIEVGSRLALKSLKNNTGLYSRVMDNDKKLNELMRGEYGLRFKDEAKRKWFKNVGLVFLILAIVLLNPAFLVVSMIAFTFCYMLWPLTDKGLELSRYLLGLKEYIKVAEVDRIKMLQSPEGAQKIGAVDVTDSSQLVELYEKVLPYAVLFGQEKEWTKRLGDIYEQTGSNPAWYGTGNAAFNAAMFSSAVSGFSTAASYSSGSSSSSGGSGGGGYSGGGGGGGGGGGW